MNVSANFPAWAESFHPAEPHCAPLSPPTSLVPPTEGIDRTALDRGSVTPPVVVTCPQGQEPYVVEQNGRKVTIGCADKSAASASSPTGPVVTVECPEGTEADVIYGPHHEAIIGCFPPVKK
jgi:hypothetical protein